MDTIINHLIEKKKAYFIVSIVAILAMILQLRHPGFDSAFENLGIQDNAYVDNASYIDSVFSEKQKIYAILTPKYETFGQIVDDMHSFEKNLLTKFDDLQFKSPIALSELIFTKETLDNAEVSQVLARLSGIQLLKEGIAIDSSSFLLEIGIDKEKQSMVKQKLDDSWTSLANHDKLSLIHI